MTNRIRFESDCETAIYTLDSIANPGIGTQRDSFEDHP